MLVVAPFYSGIAYGVGAFLPKRRVFDHLRGGSLADELDSGEHDLWEQDNAEAESAPHCDKLSK
jgi:hypothetical protein